MGVERPLIGPSITARETTGSGAVRAELCVIINNDNDTKLYL